MSDWEIPEEDLPEEKPPASYPKSNFGEGGFGKKTSKYPQPRKRKVRTPYDETVEYTDKQLAKFETSGSNTALWFLAKSDRSTSWIRKKLENRKDLPPYIMDKIIEDLTQKNLLNDKRYAENFVYMGAKYRQLGKRALSSELRMNGVDPEIIEEALSEIDDEDEEAQARELVERRLRTMRNVPVDKQKSRLVGLLARKGYGGGIAYRLVSEVIKEAAENAQAELDEEELEEEEPEFEDD